MEASKKLDPRDKKIFKKMKEKPNKEKRCDVEHLCVWLKNLMAKYTDLFLNNKLK